MSSAYTTAAKNAMLNHLASLVKFVSLHSDTPATAANEISGGGYQRQSVEWNTAASGALTASNQPVFTVPAGAQVVSVGFWSAATGGTQYGWADVTEEVYANPGTYTLQSITLDLNK